MIFSKKPKKQTPPYSFSHKALLYFRTNHLDNYFFINELPTPINPIFRGFV